MCTRVFIGFLWILEKTGTLLRVRLLGVPEFYGVLWILEIIWYTLESEILRCTRILWGSSGFLKKLVHLRARGSCVYQDSIGFCEFSRKSGTLG